MISKSEYIFENQRVTMERRQQKREAELKVIKSTPEPLLTPDQAAEYLGVRVSMLQRWRMTGEGPKYVNLASKYKRYRKSDLDDYIDSKIVSSTSE